MIVITGPGRSGTSFLARLYKELGFDPGGRWLSFHDAGFEHPDVVAINVKVARAMGVSIRERRGGSTLEAAGQLVRLSEGRVPARLHRSIANAVDAVRYRRDCPDLVKWESVEDVAARYGESMRELAKELTVVKDPRFCFTIAAWLASGADIEAVVFAIRPLDAMADSRVRTGMYSGRARAWAKHNYAYGTGLLLLATSAHRLPVSMLRFPDFLEAPEELYGQLPLPEPRSQEEFVRAFEAVHDPTLVHDSR